MALETAVIENWVSNTFVADPVIASLIGQGVYLLAAPQGFAQLYILLIFQQGADENGCGERGYAQPLYQIKAVGKTTDIPALRTLAGRIDALLQDTRIVTAGYYLRFQREQPLRYVEISEGIEYIHEGGMYRCWASPAA